MHVDPWRHIYPKGIGLVIWRHHQSKYSLWSLAPWNWSSCLDSWHNAPQMANKFLKHSADEWPVSACLWQDLDLNEVLVCLWQDLELNEVLLVFLNLYHWILSPTGPSWKKVGSATNSTSNSFLWLIQRETSGLQKIDSKSWLNLIGEQTDFGRDSAVDAICEIVDVSILWHEGLELGFNYHEETVDVHADDIVGQDDNSLMEEAYESRDRNSVALKDQWGTNSELKVRMIQTDSLFKNSETSSIFGPFQLLFNLINLSSYTILYWCYSRSSDWIDRYDGLNPFWL